MRWPANEPNNPKRQRRARWFQIATLLLALVIIVGAAVVFYLSQNLAPIARWGVRQTLPGAKVDVKDVRFKGPGTIAFSDLLLIDPATGKELVRLERGKVVFNFEDIARRQIGELHFENPLFRISPGWSGLFPKAPPEAGKAAPAKIRRIVCDYGEIIYDGEPEGKPRVTAKFSFDWKDFDADASKPLTLTCWDIRATAPGFEDPFLVLDLVNITSFPQGIFERNELHNITILNGHLAVGSALEQLAGLQKPSPTPSVPASIWRVGSIDVSGVQAHLGDNAWRSGTDIVFSINTTLRNITPAEITETLGGTEQLVELHDLVIPSPRDPFIRVLTLRSVFIRFTIAGLIDKEIREITVLNPVVHIGEDLFLYMDKARENVTTASGEATPGWRIGKLDVKFGSIMVGSGGRSRYGLPLSFQTTVENISLDDLTTLQLRGSLEIPKQEYEFPSYQIELSTSPGELFFSYPPEKSVSNVVSTIRIDKLRWRQYTASNAWISATFDREGINSTFGGTLYSGSITGGFGFFFEDKSPWIGWLSGTKVNLSSITDIIAPQNFRMTGPLNFTAQINAEAQKIRRVKGLFTTPKPGRMEIVKIDDLLARIPTEWSNLKKSSLRVALEVLRDFNYDKGEGGFWFTDGQGMLDLKLQGPLGSRTLKTVLHANENPKAHWKKLDAAR
jgi:hypothetical protein